MHEILKPPVF